MKSKNIKKQVLTLSLAMTMLVPMFNINTISTSAETTTVINKVDESFAPSRTDIPYYLSKYSSYQGEMIKKIWAKVFYEELNWNTSVSQNENYYFYDSKFDAWYKKYNHGYNSSGQEVPMYYTGLGGVTKQLDHQITYSTGDFDAFLGNTLEANPEFLGQLLGLSGYEKLGTNDDGNELMKKVIVTYLSDPVKYEYVAKSICNLTKDGTYIGDSKTASNNILKNSSYNGTTDDIYVLICLASLYEGDNDETYLSQKQVDWLKSYQLYLYDDYVANGNSSIAKRFSIKKDGKAYYPIYDLIARSTYAANNRSGKGQEFFNYVESSGTGSGAFLNLAGAGITGLDSIDNIEAMFEFSNGYCASLHSGYHENETNCKHIDNGGKATDYDKYAYLLNAAINRGGLVKTYVTENSTTNYAYQSEEEGWLIKFEMRHTQGGVSQFYQTTVSHSMQSAQGPGCGGEVACESASCSDSVSSSFVIASGSNDFLPNGVSFTFSYNGNLQSWSVVSNGVDVSSKCSLSGSTLNYSNLNKSERAGAVFTISLSKTETYSGNGADCNKRYDNGTCACVRVSYGGHATVSAGGNLTQIVKRDDCLLNGHEWTGQITWTKDMQYAKVYMFCKKNVNHEKEIIKPVTVTESGNMLIYTVRTGVYDPATGKEITFSRTVNKNGGSASEYVTFNSSNTTGSLSARSVSDSSWVSPVSGSRSPNGTFWTGGYVIKNTSCSISKVTVKPGFVKPGAKSLTFNVSAGNDLTSLDIVVYNNRGQVIADNHDPSKPNNYAYFVGVNDYDLETCYVIMSGSASTTNSVKYVGCPTGVNPSTAIAYISFNGVTVNY